MRATSRPVPASSEPPAPFLSAVPPTTMSLPPGRRVWKAQNREVGRAALAALVKAPVFGSQRLALVRPSSRSHMRTSPAGPTARWTATKPFSLLLAIWTLDQSIAPTSSRSARCRGGRVHGRGHGQAAREAEREKGPP